MNLTIRRLWIHWIQSGSRNAGIHQGTRLLLVVAATLCITSCDSPSYDESSIRSISQLEELVYADYFNSALQLELARSYWSQFEKSARGSENDASQCITAYLVATSESGGDSKIKSEFKRRFDVVVTQAGGSGTSFDTVYNNMKLLYEEGTRPTVNMILSLKDDFRSLKDEMQGSERVSPSAQKAHSAVMRHIKKVYDVATGRQRIVGPSGGSLKFALGFYTKWNRGLRGYGLVLPKQDDLVSTFKIEEVLAAPLRSQTLQIGSGASEGLYLLNNGNVVVPGLKHFESALAQTKPDMQ